MSEINRNNIIEYPLQKISNEEKFIKYLRFVFRDLYVAKHLGRNGGIINVPKIRTMYSGAESHLMEIIEQNGLAEDDKPRNDPRIMPSRRLLRKFFIDEVPQIPYNLCRRKSKRTFRFVGVRSKSEEYWKNYPEQHKQRVINSPYYCGFLGVHRYNPKRTGTQNERRFIAEHKLADKKNLSKLRSYLVNIKYSSIIAYNIIFGKTKGG